MGGKQSLPKHVTKKETHKGKGTLGHGQSLQFAHPAHPVYAAHRRSSYPKFRLFIYISFSNIVCDLLRLGAATRTMVRTGLKWGSCGQCSRLCDRCASVHPISFMFFFHRKKKKRQQTSTLHHSCVEGECVCALANTLQWSAAAACRVYPPFEKVL